MGKYGIVCEVNVSATSTWVGQHPHSFGIEDMMDLEALE